MKTLRMLATTLVMTALCLNFTACRDNDDEEIPGYSIVNPSNVFTGKRIKAISGGSMTYDANGLLTKIEFEEGLVVFEYHNVTRSINQEHYITMKVINDKNTPDKETYIYDMELNEQGFVKYAEQTHLESEGNIETYKFNYDSDGHLIYIESADGMGENPSIQYTNITYKDGNIIETSSSSSDEPGKITHVISYTSDKVSKLIENKGSIMYFDETFDVDMDDFSYAYYAGLLGKATKNLPVKCNSANSSNYEFAWTLDNNGYPTKLVTDDGVSESDVSIEW